MILRRVIGHFRKQEWTAIVIDFTIVASAFSTSVRRRHDPSPD
jgi:hypothetical protein